LLVLAAVRLMTDEEAVRDAGFTKAALAWPRSPLAVRLLAAFNGAPPGWQPPRGWHFFPNEHSAAAWSRVIEAGSAGASPLDLMRAYAPSIELADFPNVAAGNAWSRVALVFQAIREAA
jgi:hypothetical protein